MYWWKYNTDCFCLRNLIIRNLLFIFSELESCRELKFIGDFNVELDLLLKFKYLFITVFGLSISFFNILLELNLFKLILGLLFNVFMRGFESFILPSKVLLKLCWFLTLLIKSMIVEFCFDWLLRLTFYLKLGKMKFYFVVTSVNWLIPYSTVIRNCIFEHQFHIFDFLGLRARSSSSLFRGVITDFELLIKQLLNELWWNFLKFHLRINSKV